LAHEQERHTGKGTACSNIASAPKENIVSHCSTKLTNDCNCEQLEIVAESKDKVQTKHNSAEEKHEGTTQQKQRMKPPKKNFLTTKAKSRKKDLQCLCKNEDFRGHRRCAFLWMSYVGDRTESTSGELRS
jgi:hypothetical protein